MNISVFSSDIAIIDREDEIRLISDLSKETEFSQVIVLCSKTAIGKSTLTKKLMMMDAFRIYNTISVRTSPINKADDSAEGAYINLIFNRLNECVVNYQNNEIVSFDNYIAKSKDKLIKKRVVENLVQNLPYADSKNKLLRVLMHFVAKRLFRTGEFNAYNIIDNNDSDSRRIKSSYIQYVLLNSKTLLCIDNIQNIDETSLREICSWMCETLKQGNLFLFEFTMSETLDSDKKLHYLLSRLEDPGLRLTHMILPNMPEQYIADMIDKRFPNKPLGMNFNLDLLSYYQNKANGNLRELFDFTLCYGKDLAIKTNSTSVNIESLSEQARYVLSVLIYLNGKSTLSLLCDVLCADYQLIRRHINELKEHLIIDESSNHVFISHASIVDIWNSSKGNRFAGIDASAYASIEQYCLGQLKECKNIFAHDDAWCKLLHIYFKREPHKIENMLDWLNAGGIVTISPQNAWRYLSALVDRTKNNVSSFHNLYKKIIHICFEFELYSEGYQCVQIVKSNLQNGHPDVFLLWESMLLSALDRHTENIALFENSEKYLTNQSMVYTNLCLTVLSSYRSVGRVNECRRLHSILMNNRQIRIFDEYGYFLRLTNIYTDHKYALKYARKSVRFFKKRNNIIQAGKSLITEAKLLSNIGKTKIAISKIKEAESLLRNQRFGTHMIYSNYAAFLLLAGQRGDDIWEYLEKSADTAVVPYDKLAVLVNKLAWCYETKRYQQVDYIANIGNKVVPLEPDVHVSALFFYNLHIIYSEMNCHDMAQFYYEKACDIKEYCKYVKDRIDGEKDRHLSFRLRKPWNICFLSYWTYDLSETSLKN